MEQFLKKIEDRAACVAVIGLDVDTVRVGRLKCGESYIKDIPSEDLQKIIADGRFVATTALSFLAEADACCICVPTPLGKHNLSRYNAGTGPTHVRGGWSEGRCGLWPGLLTGAD